MSQSYFYIRVSSEKKLHLIVTTKMIWYLLVSKLIYYFRSKRLCVFCSKLDFFADILMKSDFTNFFFRFELLFLTRLYYKIMYDYLQIWRIKPKKGKNAMHFLLNPSFKTGNNVKKHKNFFLFESRTKKKYNEVFSSLLYYK